MVVETDFADRPRRRRRRELLADDGNGALRIVRELMRLMRVDADGKPRLGPELREARRLRRFAGVAALEDDQHTLDAGLTRPRHDLVEIVGERFIREVAMRINHSVTRVGPHPNATDARAPTASVDALR